MRVPRLWVGLMVILAMCLAVRAHTGVYVDKTCPYDGTKFRFYQQMSGSSFDKGLDLMPLGPIMSPWPMASCPTDGFVFFKPDYSIEELERLRPLIFSAHYQALKEETPYYRAAWLLDRTGEAHAKVSWTLLKASWEARNTPERYRRYAEELVKRLPDDIATATGESRFAFQLLYAELLRRLGRFDEAIEFLSELEAQGGSNEAALVGYEKELALRRDDGPHRMSEAEKKGRD